jgi:hypothetical protein
MSFFLDLAQTNRRILIPSDAPNRLFLVAPVRGAQADRDVRHAAPVISGASTLRMARNDAGNDSA